MKHLLCAPDSFKGTINAPDAAQAMADGGRGAGWDAQACPIADGGEGTMDLIVRSRSGRRDRFRTIDSRGREIEADIGFIDGGTLAIIEMASAAGFESDLAAQQNPLNTTTFGVGQLLAIAARTCDEIIITMGGTSTVDGGTGILQAMGARFLDGIGQPLEDFMTGGMLDRLGSVELPRKLPRIRAAVDVLSPLLGEQGAARMFGPQKGADADAIDRLEAGLTKLAHLLDPNETMRDTPGAGAAGGAAFGLLAGAAAEIVSGAELVLEQIGFDQLLQEHDWLLVGEGCLDAQSMLGKAALVAARRGQLAGLKVGCLCGQIGDGWEDALRQQGGPLDAVWSLADTHGLEACMQEPARCLQEATMEIIHSLSN